MSANFGKILKILRKFKRNHEKNFMKFNIGYNLRKLLVPYEI